MKQKNLFLISSLVFIILATIISFVVLYKQQKNSLSSEIEHASYNHTKISSDSTSSKKNNNTSTTDLTTKKQTSSQNIKKTSSKKEKPIEKPKPPHIKNSKTSIHKALPSSYGTTLQEGLPKRSKEKAIEKLPLYYGTAKLTDRYQSLTKADISQELPEHYGTMPYSNIIESLDKKYQPAEFYEHKPIINFKVDADTFFTGSSNLALLNEQQQYDKSVFFQTLINLPIQITVPAQEWGKVEFNFTGRINTIWGNSEQSRTSREFVKIGRAVTETNHYHEIDRPLFWVRETWLKLYSQSEKTSAQFGFFPKQIGLGLILGNHYKSGNPLLTSTLEKMIDQFRPGFELSTTFGQHDYTLSAYYSMYKNNATSFDRQVEFTQGQGLCNCGEGPPFQQTDPSRPIFQTSHLAIVELDIPLNIKKSMHHRMHIKPFILYNQDRNQTVEFFGDAESNLVTIGSTCSLKNDTFELDIECAGNFGYQEVKAWDRNVTEEHARMTLTHLFAKCFDNCSDNNTNCPSCDDDGARSCSSCSPNDEARSCSSCSSSNSNDILIDGLSDEYGEFILSPVFPYPTNEDVSLQYAAGTTFQQEDPCLIVPSPVDPNETINCNTIFKNSYSRFRKCYRNTYRAFMAAADMAYKCSDSYKFGLIAGYASGDENPNDSKGKAYLYRLRSDWNEVRQDFDHCYNGFVGVQSLYTGKHVRTLQLLRSHRLNRPLSEVPELTANLFSNLTYGGVGFWYEKDYYSGKLRFNSNVIAMGLAQPVRFGFDPVVQDIFETFNFEEDESTKKRFASHDKQLSQYLGIEWNMFLEFFAKNNVTFYGIVSIFIPGTYYKDINILSDCVGQVIPLKNQYIGIAKDTSGFENAERTNITLKADTAVVAYAGIKFNFDTTTWHTPFKSKRKKK